MISEKKFSRNRLQMQSISRRNVFFQIHISNNCIFSKEDDVTTRFRISPSSDILSWVWTELNFSKVVYILEGFGTIWNILKSGGKIWISIWHWSWKWVKSKIKFEFGLNIKVSEVFLKKSLWFPLLLDSGIRGFLFLRGK